MSPFKFDFHKLIAAALFVFQISILVLSIAIFRTNIVDQSIAIILISLCILTTILFCSYILYLYKKNLYSFSHMISKLLSAIKDKNQWTLNENEYKSKMVKNIIKQGEEVYLNIKKSDKEKEDILYLITSVTTHNEITKLFEDLMPKISQLFDSIGGAFYSVNAATNKLELKYSIGFNKNIYSIFDINIGEGMVGLAAISKKISIVKDVPKDSIFITKTFLGKIVPRNVMLVPIINKDKLLGVLCLAGLQEYTDYDIKSMDVISYYLGIAVNNCNQFERIKRLSGELKFQNSLIQSLNEELEIKMSDRNMFLKDILNSIKDYSIYVIDKNASIIEWNKGAELLYGYKEEEIKGKNIQVLYSDQDMDIIAFKKHIDTVLQKGHYNEQGWRIKQDGTKYFADISVFSLYNSNNDLIGATIVTKDITNLKIIENEIFFQNEFAKSLTNESKRPVIITNQECIILVNNELAEKTLNSKNLVNENICSLFEDPGDFYNYIRDRENDGIEKLFKLKDSDKYLYVKYLTIKDELNFKKNIVFYLREDKE